MNPAQTPTEPDSLSQVAPGDSLRSPACAWLFVLPRLVFKVWCAAVFFLTMLVLYVPFKVLLSSPARYPAAFRLMRAWSALLNILLMTPMKARQEAALPRPPYVVCINHGSYLDIVHVFRVIPDYFLFMGKYELLRWPLFRIFFKDMHIAVNRSSSTGAARALLKAGNALDQGFSVCIFPEGTIPGSAPRMKPFKDGAFRLAIEKQVPVVPVTFLDNWRLFGDPEKLLGRAQPGQARAVVHPAIATSGMHARDIDTLRRRVFEAIEAPLRREYPCP